MGAVLVNPALASPALAQEEFPARIQAGGRALVRNGVGSRLYSVFNVEVYRAALYLEAPSREAAAILASTGPRLIIARYRRNVPLRGVLAAWEASFAPAPVPPDFAAWLAPLTAGDEERTLFMADHVRLEGTGRAPLRLEGAGVARTQLLAWIGPNAPTEALRQGLLGLR